jgi:hypothetical protein
MKSALPVCFPLSCFFSSLAPFDIHKEVEGSTFYFSSLDRVQTHLQMVRVSDRLAQVKVNDAKQDKDNIAL